MLIRAYFPSLILIVSAVFQIHASENYVSQFYVDSLIDKAMLEFNSLSDPSNSKSHESVVQYAKEITSRLRSIAKNDLHQKYILSKVSELESQIYLEEHELLLEKAQWKQKHSDQIIVDFNKEIGSDHPDFNILYALQKKAFEVDTAVFLQMDHSIKKQAESLRKLLPDLIEQNLQENKLDAAHKELLYCQLYSTSFGFTKLDLARLEARLISRSSIEQSLRSLKFEFDSLKTHLSQVHFKDARRIESVIKFQIDLIKQEMLPIEWNRYYLNWKVLVQKLNSKEDSCIEKAWNLLKTGNILQASSLLDTLSKSGVHPDKIAIVNKKILDKIIIQSQVDTYNNIYAFDADTGDTYPVFKDLVLAAKTRVLSERDSISKKREENTTLTHVTQIRREHLLLSQETQQKRLESRRSAEFNKAHDELIAIYVYIEKDSIDLAKKLFINAKKLLENNFSKQDLIKLDSALTRISPSVNLEKTQ
jgi:hypothetical protein